MKNLCATCAHNVGLTTMDCEYDCTGVDLVVDDGETVCVCDDYTPREAMNVAKKDRQKGEKNGRSI